MHLEIEARRDKSVVLFLKMEGGVCVHIQNFKDGGANAPSCPRLNATLLVPRLSGVRREPPSMHKRACVHLCTRLFNSLVSIVQPHIQTVRTALTQWYYTNHLVSGRLASADSIRRLLTIQTAPVTSTESVPY